MAEETGMERVGAEEVPPEVREAVAGLDEVGRRFVMVYDGSNRKEALEVAGLRPNAFRMRLIRNASFRRVVGLIDDARKAVVANTVSSTLAPQAEALVDELAGIALKPVKGARELDAKLRAIIVSLRILGVQTESPSGPLVNITHVDARRIDTMAIELWTARKARERSALESTARDGEDPEPLESAPEVEVEMVDDGGKPRLLPARPLPCLPTPAPRAPEPGQELTEEEERWLYAADPFDLRPQQKRWRGGGGF